MSTLLEMHLLVGFMIAMSKMDMGMGCCVGYCSHGGYSCQEENSIIVKQNKHDGRCCRGDQKGSVRILYVRDPAIDENANEKSSRSVLRINSAATNSIQLKYPAHNPLT